MKRGRLITIGSFDGVHRGHAALLDRTVREARKRKIKSLALTFRVPPRLILDHWNDGARPSASLLSDPIEKDHLIKKHGIDQVIALEFDRKIASLRAFSFFRDVLLRQYNAKGIVIGLDFRFGEHRSAGALELVRWGGEFGIPVWVIPPVKWKRHVVSSTMIRKLMQEGGYRSAAAFLGHPYLIRGNVVRGRGAGRKIGFPTANLRLSPDKILPRGVFAVRGWVEGARGGKAYRGVCNIGVRPTLVKSSPVVAEVHMFGQPHALAGKTLWVELLTRLREEKRFGSLSALKRAIVSDIRRARAGFSLQGIGQ